MSDDRLDLHPLLQGLFKPGGIAVAVGFFPLFGNRQAFNAPAPAAAATPPLKNVLLEISCFNGDLLSCLSRYKGASF